LYFVVYSVVQVTLQIAGIECRTFKVAARTA